VHKKDPRTRLDTRHRVRPAAARSPDPGFTFMNGPGNDLEGIAGQVAAGCNLILFVTGNGSITNFPFVPTLKITTTTRRHQLLIHEMDINAGRYLDGEPMEALTADAFELAGGDGLGPRKTGRARRPRAGVHLAQLAADRHLAARRAARADPRRMGAVATAQRPSGLSPGADTPSAPVARLEVPHRRAIGHRAGRPDPAHEHVLDADRAPGGRAAQREAARRDQGISRFVAFTHSEGCGFGGETMYELLHRTYHGYVVHPNVAAALLLEHGCEKMPNDVMRRQLESAGLPTRRYGWASVQLDGGIDKALGRIEGWFDGKLATLPPGTTEAAGPGALALALLTAAPVAPATAAALAAIAGAVLDDGGSVLLVESDPLLANPGFRTAILGATPPRATLAYGEPRARPGLHVVASETDHWTENLTGLCGCGAQLALTVVSDHARQGHPLLPVVQVAEARLAGRIAPADIDVFLTGDAAADEAMLAGLLAAVARGDRVPAASALGNVDFQLTRGLLGLTT
jgi:altronate dehydratase